jgi:hypothetical protein
VAGKKLWVGIEVGKQFHHACAVDADGSDARGTTAVR